jgi:hypothetical protein
MKRKDYLKYGIRSILLFIISLLIVSFVIGNITIFSWDGFDRFTILLLWGSLHIAIYLLELSRKTL